ncbi:hypothetical protein ABZX85_41495 [Streptomyces sp. NPDC004539]|uniref:effector-associated constant component EACC1 n=1 Tax=Streptomyces sp. NPDC004539 TaxID=3154280 RepID=UPI0033B70F50
MEIRFDAEGPDLERELRSLHGWLADDLALRGHVRLNKVVTDEPGRMSPGLAAVLAIVSTTAGLAQLPFSYLAWRQGIRPRRPRITINIVNADPAEVEEILRRFRTEDEGDR